MSALVACRRPALLVLAGLLSAARSAGAPPPGEAPPQACALGEAAALAEIACELTRSLPLQGIVLSVAAASPAGVPPDRGTRLAEHLSRAVASVSTTQGATATPLASAPELATARSQLAAGTALLYLTSEITRGALRVTGTLHVPGQTIWDRVREPAPAPRATATARRSVDAEIQAFVGTVPLTAAMSTTRASHGVPDVIAASCEPFPVRHGDEPMEVFLVGRKRVLLGRVEGSKYAPSAEVLWSSLSPIAAAPLREPIAATHALPGVGVAIGTTDRARGVVLSPTLALLHVLDPPIPWEGVGCVSRAGLGVGGPRPCGIGVPDGPKAFADGAMDAIAGTRAVDTRGRPRVVAASREPNGTVSLRSSTGEVATVPGAGAALALGDLDRDGQVELLTSEPVRDESRDAVVVRTWGADGQVKERLRVPVPDGVRALSSCHPDGPGGTPFVVVTAREIWVVR